MQGEIKILENNLITKYINYGDKKVSPGTRYKDMIKASEHIRIDINKEDDPFKMLDMSLLCIAFLSGDTTFYEINRAKLIEIINAWHLKNKI